MFNETSIFSTDFPKKNHIPDSDNIHAVEAKLFHGDRHDGADSRFSQILPARLITD
jgi:hypothetical protein